MNDCFALVSSEITQVEYAALSAEFTVITLPSDDAVDAPVCSHPDMILCTIGDALITSRAYYSAHRATVDYISELGGLRLILSDHPRGAKYPADVGFNTAVTSSHVICNTKTVCREILAAAREQGLETVHVNQGYSACSCIVTDDAVITSDIGIHAACTEHGIPSHLVSNRGISLPGYDVGLIGGSGGFSRGTLYLYGDICGMECEREIELIAKRYGYRIRTLSDLPLTDRGGIKFIKYSKRQNNV